MRDVITLQKIWQAFLICCVVALVTTVGIFLFNYYRNNNASPVEVVEKSQHWMLLERKSNKEYLYIGTPGNKKKSKLLKSFKVKTGVPGKKPTPLPQLFGREYWQIIDKMDSSDNPETAPYFLILDIPVGETEPYGPEPYSECNGQCNWELPGYFGLHGVASDESKLSVENAGSSGCIRHTDKDISYLYNLFDLKKEKIRYYVVDM